MGLLGMGPQWPEGMAAFADVCSCLEQDEITYLRSQQKTSQDNSHALLRRLEVRPDCPLCLTFCLSVHLASFLAGSLSFGSQDQVVLS